MSNPNAPIPRDTLGSPLPALLRIPPPYHSIRVAQVTAYTPTDLVDLSTIEEQVLINAIVAAHGDLTLAAERLHTTPTDIINRLPTINKEALKEAISTATLLQSFEVLTSVKAVVLSTLSELPPAQRARLLLDLLGRMAPQAPVQLNQYNLNAPQGESEVKGELLRRLENLSAGSLRESGRPVAGEIVDIVAQPASGAN